MKWAVEDRSAWPENAAEASGYAADFIRRKQNEGLLGAEEASLADPEMIARFISSERGREVRAAEKVRCEVPFTYRTDMRKYLGAADKVLRDAARGGGGEGDAEGRETRPAEHSSQERSLSVENNLKEEKIIVIQGVVDLYYKLRDRVVIVDFKTDHIRGDGSVDNIAAYDLQLTCYRDALGEISGRNIDESVLFFLRNGQEHSI
ncbi:MAG: PD-(D/E)XK nuclease family protein, partial [Clostridia bacterium]|nr:PD-(D/E)XK nuclease family protein [Clostridia bacterium]